MSTRQSLDDSLLDEPERALVGHGMSEIEQYFDLLSIALENRSEPLDEFDVDLLLLLRLVRDRDLKDPSEKFARWLQDAD